MRSRIKNKLKRFMEVFPGQDYFVKRIERLRGLYVYPDRMIGRNLKLGQNEGRTDVLVFAAHCDDDILGLGVTLHRHRLNGDTIKIIFTTNGTSDWFGPVKSWNLPKDESLKRAANRYQEAVYALSVIDIAKDDIFCLGYPDGGTHRYLNNMSEDVSMIIETWKPERVYVHSIEGGHSDHDMTSFVVKSSCERIGFSNVYEWAQYNPDQLLGTMDVKFLPNRFHDDSSGSIKVHITEEEQLLKKKMLSFHASQNVEQYYLQGETIRKATLAHSSSELLAFCKIPPSRLKAIVSEFQKRGYQSFKGD